MITATVAEELFGAILRYNQAVDRNSGMTTERERVKNFLFHYRDDIYELMRKASEDGNRVAELEEKVAVQAKMIETLTQKLNAAKKKDPPANKG